MKKPELRIFWSEEDGVFVVTCPEYPGFSTFGDTRIEALREAELILPDFIELTSAQTGNPMNGTSGGGVG